MLPFPGVFSAIAENVRLRGELRGEMIQIPQLPLAYEDFASRFVRYPNRLLHVYIIPRKKASVNPLITVFYIFSVKSRCNLTLPLNASIYITVYNFSCM